MLLQVENLRVVYHDVISVLHGVSLGVEEGELLVIIGANGAGKTTLLRTICGMIDFYDGKVVEGDVKLGGHSIRSLHTTEILKKHRLTYVMEDRPVFWYLTVEENLLAAAHVRWDDQVSQDLEEVYGYFPVLKRLREKRAGLASGGEQADAGHRHVSHDKAAGVALGRALFGIGPSCNRGTLLHSRKAQHGKRGHRGSSRAKCQCCFGYRKSRLCYGDRQSGAGGQGFGAFGK